MRNGDVSYWWAARGGFPARRASLPGPTEADVCIVGGGYTGLWTAYYLKGLRPELRVVLLEAAFAGFGASGRNGGWVTAELPGARARYARGPRGTAGVRDMEAALRDTVDEVGRVIAAEAIPADWVGHRWRTWEPEPARWAGVHGLYALYRLADRLETGGADGKPAQVTMGEALARLGDAISGIPH